MTKTERIRAAIQGERPDVIPYSLWSHLPEIDLDPVRLAEATYDFYKTYDVDFIKTMNNGMYPVEDFGCTVDFSQIAKGGVATIVKTPVGRIEDWNAIRPQSVHEGALRRELYSLELLMQKLQGEQVPVIFTAFSPITTADKLSGKRLLEHIRQGGGPAIHRALEAITQTTCELVRQATALGADGIFFASQMSNYDVMDEETYREFGAPYDIRVLESSTGWFNALHAHGDDIMFGVLKDYPVQVFNWHVWDSLPDLKEGAGLTGKCVMGGLRRSDITEGNRNALRSQIYRCVDALKGRGHILTPGCVIRYPLDEQMLRFVKEAKAEVESAMMSEICR
jgi:uroporphyrinogen decarboxylase